MINYKAFLSPVFLQSLQSFPLEVQLVEGLKVQIKHIVIVKCDLFFHCHDAKEISSYYFHDTKPCAKHTKTCEFHIFCWDHFYKLNEWYLVDCFHPEYRVSSQIMVCSYCIAKCKNFSISPLQESPALPNKLEGFGPPQVIFFQGFK